MTTPSNDDRAVRRRNRVSRYPHAVNLRLADEDLAALEQLRHHLGEPGPADVSQAIRHAIQHCASDVAQGGRRGGDLED